MTPAGRGPTADTTPLPATYQSCPPLLGAPLQGAHRADIAIVGAGFTGLSAALHLRQAGCAVIVLDAKEVGWGGSGRAFGQVVPYLKHDEAGVQASFGPDWGERLIEGAAAGPDLVARLIARHAIDCEQTGRGLIFAAHAARAEPGLERRARFWQDRGADVVMLDTDGMAAQTGSRFYAAGLLDRRGFCLNPLAYARGLARAFLAAGGALHENSPALSLHQAAAGWQVRTTGGAIDACHVLLATDAYTDALWPGLARTLVPLRAYQAISQKLPDPLRRTILPGGQAVTDTRRLYSGIRLRADGRLHVSVGGPAFRNDGVPRAALATRRVQSLFPHLPPPAWDSTVAGWVGMTADRYPHVHRLAPNLVAAIGLSGRGIALGTLLGRDAALRILGRPQSEWMIPDTNPRPIRAGALARPALSALLACYRALDAMELRRDR